MKTIHILVIALVCAAVLPACAIFQKKPKSQPPIKTSFGPVEEQMAEFSKTFDEARAKGLSAEEKLKLVVAKAKELEKLNQ